MDWKHIIVTVLLVLGIILALKIVDRKWPIPIIGNAVENIPG